MVCSAIYGIEHLILFLINNERRMVFQIELEEDDT